MASLVEWKPLMIINGTRKISWSESTNTNWGPYLINLLEME